MKILRSLVAPAEVAELVAAAYDLGGPVRCAIHSLGDNDNYLVRAGAERYLLRLYIHGRHWPYGREDRLFELEWLTFLAGRGLPVIPPVPRADGGLLGSLQAPEGERDLAVFHFAPGEPDLFPEDPARLFRFGAAMARLHAASDEFQPRHRRFHIDLDFLIEAPLARSEAFLAETGRGEPLALVRELARRLRQALAGLPREAPRYGVIGGDFHGENHHFTAAGDPVFFDFDLCGYGWRAYDLAVPLWYARRELGTVRALDLFAPILAGYGSIRPLDGADRSAIAAFVLARQLWLVGEHVADVETLGVARVGDAYWRRAVSLLREWLETPLDLAGLP